MIVGIDFSINSTAVCLKSADEIKLFSFVPNYKKTLSAFKMHEEISEFVDIVSYQKESSVKDPIEDQSVKLSNADILSYTIIKSIKPFIEGIPDIRIEGFSFGSKGNSFIDLITYNTFLKTKLILEWGHCISVVSPKTVKKLYTGNGNANKVDMIKKYLEIGSGTFHEKLSSLNLKLEPNSTIPKPLDDLVDSVALSEIALPLSGSSS
jgi:hypothetical protein